MFSRTSDHKSQETKRPSNGKSAVPSILSAGARMVGNLRTDGDVHIDGYHEGEIHAKTIQVSRDGVVAGAITADTVQIDGQVDGAIAARTVTLGKSSRVAGDVHHETLAIEPGARLLGKCVPREQAAETDGETALSSSLGYTPAAAPVSEPETPDEEDREKENETQEPVLDSAARTAAAV
jgi:cytoskeletal protein CcmA (bactofilin family)